MSDAKTESDPALLQLASDREPSLRRAGVAFGVLALSLFAAMVAIGAVPQLECPDDVSFHLDGAWRLMSGQRPHTDFYSPIGVFPLLVLRGGAALSPVLSDAPARGYALLVVLVAALVWPVARRRLSALGALAYAGTTIGLLAGARPLGYAAARTSYAMQYNRLGWALVLLLALLVALPPREPLIIAAERREGFLAGVIVAALAFVKVNYLVAALGLLPLVLIGARPGTWRRSFAIAAPVGAAAGALGAFAYLRFDVVAWAHDLRVLSAVQHRADLVLALEQAALGNAALLVVTSIAVVLATTVQARLPPRAGEAADAPSPIGTALSACVLAALGIVVCMANQQLDDVPTCAAAALVVGELARRALVASGGLAGSRGVAWLASQALALSLAANLVIPDVASLAYAAAAQRSRTSETIRASALSTLVLPPAEAAELNDGLALIRSVRRPDDRVLSMAWVNPFSAALGLSPPLGDALFWHAGRVIDAEHAPPAGRLFSAATIVMVPRSRLGRTNEHFKIAAYGAAILLRLRRTAESRYWTLYATPR